MKLGFFYQIINVHSVKGTVLTTVAEIAGVIFGFIDEGEISHILQLDTQKANCAINN